MLYVWYTLWFFNIAMENGPIGLPIKNGAFPWRTVKEPEGICLHDWVIYVGQMLVNIPAPWSLWDM